MDFDFNNLITDIQVHPKKPNLLAVGVGESIRFIEHDTTKEAFHETRSIKVDGFARGFRFSPKGESLMAVLEKPEMRVYDGELNLKKSYVLDEEVSAIGQPFVSDKGENFGIDVLIGTDSGMVSMNYILTIINVLVLGSWL